MQFFVATFMALNKEKGPLPSFKPAKFGGGTQKKLRKAKPEGEQLFLFDDKLRSEAPMFKLTKPSILADHLLPVVVRRLKHRGIWGRKRKRENKGYLPNMKTSKRMSMALYIVCQLLPIRNDPVHHAEKYPTPPAVYSGKHGSVSILNMYSSTLPPLTSGDCTTKHYSDNSFTVIYSRAILHIQLAPFDLTKKKKKKTFVVHDAIEDSAEPHGRHTISCLIVQEEFIGYIADHPNDEEEVEGIDLHQQRYPWEGSGMDYLYDEVSISLDGLRSIFESRRFFNMQNHNAVGVVSEITKLAICQDSKSISADEHPNDEEEVEGIDLHQQRYPWEGSDMDYLYDEVSISLDGLRSIFESRRFEITKLAMCQDNKNISADAPFDSTCSGICRSADPIVEVNMQCVDLGYIAEHPNDEEEVEGIDMHQQRYPWEGSDIDYLYDESSFAQLLSMELTLEIDGAIFRVPNANASSNVDYQL
ncbi:hypothetical protein DY000_02032952 [Brassica cretica]|uniref:NAC domain-containing protein n=1 Tax=Brassica cretica TaxID=69181 RepID=A0ABQ7DJG6_BRACR|nr:hypothetical protein DY000_02032952 [Brassica cretica]